MEMLCISCKVYLLYFLLLYLLYLIVFLEVICASTS
jgi:hypothetical protein